MDNIKVIPGIGFEFPFSFLIPESYSPLNINIVPIHSDDILLHIDFRYPDNKISLNRYIDQQWGTEIHHEFEYNEPAFSGSIVFLESSFQIKLGGNTYDFPSDRPLIGEVFHLFSDFRHITLGSSDLPTMRLAQRWPFLSQLGTPPASNQRVQPGNIASRAVGVTGLVLCDGEYDLLERFLQASAKDFDEVLLAVYDTKVFDLGKVRQLQSRFFGLRYVVAEHLYGASGHLSRTNGSLFLNVVCGAARYKNIVFIGLDKGLHFPVRRIIKDHRLRTRQDQFVLVSDHNGKPGDLLAMSFSPEACFQNSASGASLAKEELVRRRVLRTPIRSDCLSGDWSLNVADMVDDSFRANASVRLRRPSGTSPTVAKSKPAVLFLVISCKKYRSKQQLIRDTWAKDVVRANFEYVFVEGDPTIEQATLIGDQLFVPVPDSYEYLPGKVLEAVRSSIRLFDPEYIFKIDDDCVCNVQKFLEFDYTSFDYIGTDVSIGRLSYVDWHTGATSNSQLSDLLFEIEDSQTWYDGQGGYLLSRKAASEMVALQEDKLQHILEDYAVGRALSQLGYTADRTTSTFRGIREKYISKASDFDRVVISDIGNSDRFRTVYGEICALNDAYLERLAHEQPTIA